MLTSGLFAVATFVAHANAHFRLLQPIWRGSSFVDPASQWIYPCANVNETTDVANRTLWPVSGGSVVINGSHENALTAVNLALGSNNTNFNISIVPIFNQTGAGVFCLKQINKSLLEAGFKAAGYSGLSDSRIDGMSASIQVIQLGHSGSALYNCADIRFNSTAQLLSDDQCKNGTGVGGVGIVNADAQTSKDSSPSKGSSAGRLVPTAGSTLLVALLAWGLL